MKNWTKELEGLGVRLQTKVLEREQKKLALSNQQAAADRRARLLASITTLLVKRGDTEQNRATQQAIADRS